MLDLNAFTFQALNFSSPRVLQTGVQALLSVKEMAR